LTKIQDLIYLPLDSLSVSNFNVRKRDLETDMDKLRNCIKEVGLIEPITVRKTNTGYEVIKGQRRLLAMKELSKEGYNFDTIPCILKTLTDQEAELESLIENIHRSKLHPKDLAQAINNLINRVGSKEKVAQMLGYTVDYINFWLRNLELPKETQEKFYELSKAKMKIAQPVVSSLQQTEKQVELAKELKDVSLREMVEILDRVRENPNENIQEIKQEVKEYFDETVLYEIRIKKKYFYPLSTLSKKWNKKIKKIIEEWLNETIEEHLKQEGFTF